MKQPEHTTSNSRRSFLRKAAGAGVCVAVTTALPGTVAAAPNDETGRLDAGKTGYRLTQHILDYYKSASF